MQLGAELLVLQQMEPLRSVVAQYSTGQYGSGESTGEGGKALAHEAWFDEEDYYPGTTLEGALRDGFAHDLWSARVVAAFDVSNPNRNPNLSPNPNPNPNQVAAYMAVAKKHRITPAQVRG